MTTSYTRISIIFCLYILAFICILSEPKGDEQTWLLVLIISKFIGALALYTAYKLTNKWSLTDKWVATYSKQPNLNE